MRKLLAVTIAVAGLALAGCASDTNSNREVGGPGTPVSDSATSLPVGPPPSYVGGTSPAPSTTVHAPSPPYGSPTTAALIADCPTELDAAQANGPTAKALPANVAVNFVLRCTITSNMAGRTLKVERSSGDTTALLTALRAPSGLKIKGVCPMYRQAVPYFAFVQTNGQTLAPKVPITSCGQPQADVLAALDKLTFTVLATKHE